MTSQTHVLMVVTSHHRIDEETPTGLWLEEFTLSSLSTARALVRALQSRKMAASFARP